MCEEYSSQYYSTGISLCSVALYIECYWCWIKLCQWMRTFERCELKLLWIQSQLLRSVREALWGIKNLIPAPLIGAGVLMQFSARSLPSPVVFFLSFSDLTRGLRPRGHPPTPSNPLPLDNHLDRVAQLLIARPLPHGPPASGLSPLCVQLPVL